MRNLRLLFALATLVGISRPPSAAALEAGWLRFAPSYSLSTFNGLDGFLVGTNGYRVTGGAGDDQLGWSVDGAGDVNGDGYDDCVIGAPRAVFAEGRAYVLYGGANHLPSQPVTFIDGLNGFTISGSLAIDELGTAVAGSGDFNGDGYDDLAISAPRADPLSRTNAGAIYILYGGTNQPATRDVMALDGTNGLLIAGEAAGFQCGLALAGAGDFNRDGFDDLVIGAENAEAGARTNAGKAYVIYGRGDRASSVDLASLNGTNGFAVWGEDTSDHAGKSVAGLGDFNADGYADLIIGAHTAPDFLSRGRAYVLFGESNTAAIVDLATLHGVKGFTIEGDQPFGNAGSAVGGADVNGDGMADALVGAPLANGGGTLYAIFGCTSSPASLSVSLLAGTNGFAMKQEQLSGRFGASIACARRLNGDAYDDIIIGDYLFDPGGLNDAGEAYVLMGQPRFPANMTTAALDGTNGFRLAGNQGAAEAGWSVGSAGDMDGDGFNDLLVGARSFDYAPSGPSTTLTNAGAVYVVSPLAVSEFALYDPELLAIGPTSGSAQLSWLGQSNVTYRVWARDTLGGAGWFSVQQQPSTGVTNSWSTPLTTTGPRFYRVTAEP